MERKLKMKYTEHKNKGHYKNIENLLMFDVYVNFNDGDFIEVRNPNNKALQLRVKTGVSGLPHVVASSSFRISLPLGISVQDAEGYIAQIVLNKEFAFERGFSQIGESIVEIGKDSGELHVCVMNISGTTTVINSGTHIGKVILHKVQETVEIPTPVKTADKTVVAPAKRKYNRKA